jgi:hypothetical protein
MSISHLPKTVVNMCFDEVSKISQDTTVYNMVDIDCFFVCLVVFNATFNNISIISWRSVLLVEETEGPGENHRPVASH